MPTPSGAAEHRQHGQVDADERQRDQHADQQKQRAKYLGQHDAQILVEMRPAHQPLLEQAREPTATARRRRRSTIASRPRSRTLISPSCRSGCASSSQRCADFGQHADVVEQQRAPDREAERPLRRGGRRGRRRGCAARRSKAGSARVRRPAAGRSERMPAPASAGTRRGRRSSSASAVSGKISRLRLPAPRRATRDSRSLRQVHAAVDRPGDREAQRDRRELDPAVGRAQRCLDAVEIERRQHGRKFSASRSSQPATAPHAAFSRSQLSR